MTSLTGSRIAIVSRIFTPEPAAASMRLRSLAQSLHEQGAEVVVYTTTPPPHLTGAVEEHPPFTVRRLPALRDRGGYVRGYLNYLSFDIPAFFRLVTARRFDAVVVEPPPTTGIVMRVATWLRRTPYVFYAADIWSEAAAIAGAPGLVVSVVRQFERWVYGSARLVLAVSSSVEARVKQTRPTATVLNVGNGYDESVFYPGESATTERPFLLYAGTASEVHGAGIFIEAMHRVVQSQPEARLVFIGQGSEWDTLQSAASKLPEGSVTFLPRMAPEEIATWIRRARAMLASVRPGGYEAFPTKMYASVGCGTRVIFSGEGEGTVFAQSPGVGWAVDDNPVQVAAAMLDALNSQPTAAQRHDLAMWARRQHSLSSVRARVADALRDIVA